MAGDPLTRSDRRRALAVNARHAPRSTSRSPPPSSSRHPARGGWLIAIAAVCFVALAVLTFLDEHEAERVGARIYAAGARRSRRPSPPPADDPELGAGDRRPHRRRAGGAGRHRARDRRRRPPGRRHPRRDRRAADHAHADRRPGRPRRRLPRPPTPARRRGAHHALREAPAPATRAARGRSPRSRTSSAPSAPPGPHAGLLDEMDHVVASLEALHAEVVTLGAADDEWRRADVAGQVARAARGRPGPVGRDGGGLRRYAASGARTGDAARRLARELAGAPRATSRVSFASLNSAGGWPRESSAKRTRAVLEHDAVAQDAVAARREREAALGERLEVALRARARRSAARS